MNEKPNLPQMKARGFHMLLSGKGGVGKSVVARLLAEYLTDHGDAPMAFDADPVNASFAAVPAFKAKSINLLDGDHKINASRFDEILEDILDVERSVVIDSGASSYLPLLDYMEENDLVSRLREEGFDVFLHTIINGGASLDFTTQNFNDVAKSFGNEAKVVVWLNHVWEQIARDGKPFTEWRTYQANRDRLHCILEIPKMASDMSAADFSAMLKENQSFAEATNPKSSFRVMQRSRLMKVRRLMYAGMEAMDTPPSSRKLVGMPVEKVAS